ncbi:MAG: TVP38/TMEM64 family protein [Candidatus Diapherotrites archaeon]
MGKRVEKSLKFLKENWLIILILILISTIFFYSSFSSGVIYSLVHNNPDSIISFVNSFGIFGELMFILLVILECVLAPIPAVVLYVAGGVLFGAFYGGILTLIGNLLGALIAFGIARKYGRNFVERKINKNLRIKFDNFSEKYGIFSLFILRINPLTTSDLFSYLAGLSKMKTWNFLLGTGLGLIPLIFIQTYFGEVFVKSSPILSAVIIWLSIIYLIVLVYLIWKMLLKQKESVKTQ